MIQVTTVNDIQSQFLAQLIQAFSTMGGYAYQLLFLLATLEIVMFGLIWALKQEAHWGQLMFKVIKIGLIAYVISSAPMLVDTLIATFGQVGAQAAGAQGLNSVLFAPARLWEYSYDSMMHLLELASDPKTTVGLAIIQTALGLGTIVAMALITIQVVFQLVAFYFIALFGLLLIPFGVLGSTMGLFEQVLRALLKAATRVAVIMMVLGAAVLTWRVLGLQHQGEVANINENLGLFVSALLFAYFTLSLPKLVASVVGKIDFSVFSRDAIPSTNVTVSPPTVVGGTSLMTGGGGAQANVAAPASNLAQATMIGASGSVAGGVNVTVSGTQVAGLISGPGMIAGKSAGGEMDAQEVSKSISDKLIKEMKQSFRSQQNK